MALKWKIADAAFTDLSDDLKKLYTKKGEEYELTGVEKDEDTGALRRALDREKIEKKDVQTKFDELTTEYKEFKKSIPEPGKSERDAAKLQKEYDEKFANLETGYKQQLATKDAMLKSSAVETAARGLAAKLAVKPAAEELLVMHAKQFLTAEITEEGPQLRVMDKRGQVSAKTLKDLEKEMVDNEGLQLLIKGSKAVGGANPKTLVSGAPEDFHKLSPDQKAAYLSANPDAAAQLAEQAVAAGRVF